MGHTYVSWEANTLQNNSARVVYGPLPVLRVRGYQFDLGARPTSVRTFFGIGQSASADILFQAAFIQGPPDNYAGGGNSLMAAMTKQVGGTNEVNIGASPAQDNVFAAAILKLWDPESVNKSLIMPGLTIDVPAGYYLAFYVGHSGFPVDCELQGVIHYD